jgi:hypothetical protein
MAMPRLRFTSHTHCSPLATPCTDPKFIFPTKSRFVLRQLKAQTERLAREKAIVPVDGRGRIVLIINRTLNPHVRLPAGLANKIDQRRWLGLLSLLLLLLQRGRKIKSGRAASFSHLLLAKAATEHCDNSRCRASSLLKRHRSCVTRR